MAKFRLAGLMRLRKLQEETASATLAKASGRRRELERVEDTITDRLGSHTLSAAGGGEKWLASVAARSSLMSNLQAARAAVAQAAEDEAQAQREYQAAKQQAVPLEKLEEKHRRAQALEEERAEQNVLDELASQRAARAAVAAAAKAAAPAGAGAVRATAPRPAAPRPASPQAAAPRATGSQGAAPRATTDTNCGSR